LPITIPPSEAQSFTVAAKMPQKPGLFTRKVGLLVDDDGIRRIDFRVTGRTRDVPKTSTVAEKWKE
jgi:hypothetical protein